MYPTSFLPALHMSLSRLLPTHKALLLLSKQPACAVQLVVHDVALVLASMVLPAAQRLTTPLVVLTTYPAPFLECNYELG